MELKLGSPLRSWGTRKKGKRLARSCNHVLLPRKKALMRSSCARGASRSPHSACRPAEQSGRTWSPGRVSLSHLPSGSLRNSACETPGPDPHPPGTFCGTPALLGPPGKALVLDPNCSFACRCGTLICIHVTHSQLVSTRTLVTEAEVLTAPLHCEKNAVLLPLQRTQKVLVVKERAFWHSTGKS